MVERHVAVVTDTTSSQFYFPRWYNYYCGQFGKENLFVVTSQNGLAEFEKFDLGGVWSIAHRYDDGARALTMGSAVKLLLTDYDYVDSGRC